MSTQLKPIRDGIFFQFEEDVVQKTDQQTRTQFVDKTNWGFTISSFQNSVTSPRWVIVHTAGDECPEEIKPGMRVLVEALMWTNAVKRDGETLWKTDYKQIIAIDESHTPPA